MADHKIFSLLQLANAVRRRIDEATGGQAFWVKAEIAGINHQRHVYMELVEHRQGMRVAVMRGIIWQPTMRSVRETLGEELDHVLKAGSEILFQAVVNYHPVHGLSLQVLAVDLAFSLGELERRKQATVATLKEEGLFDLNRSLPEPMVIQRIALITSVGSAAYADLMQHLRENEFGFRFHVHVFNSAVQGDNAPAELRHALALVDQQAFDAVVFIRGGGSKLDLEAFNDLDLCRMAARMAIPVMTGIGHDVDVSVLDMVAKSPHRTPTAIADHLVDKCLYFETSLNAFLVGMQRTMGTSFGRHKERLSALTELLRQRPRAHCQQHRGELHRVAALFARHGTAMTQEAGMRLRHHAHELAVLPTRRLKQVEEPRLREQRTALTGMATRGLEGLLQRVEGMREAVRLLDPDRIMARGFSITRKDGQALTDAALLHEGDELVTTFARGRVRSIVNSIEAHGQGTADL